MAYRGELVKLSKQLVEQFHQLLRCALGGQAGEAHYVCKQDAAREGQTEWWLVSYCSRFTAGWAKVLTGGGHNGF